MLKPKISICIPTYKRIDFLMEAINSVRKNRFKNFEIIVSDDDCDSSVKKAIKDLKDKRVKYFAHKKRGIQYNWNNAVKKATASYIMKLDDDDIILPGFLKKTSALLDKNPNVSIVFTAYSTRYVGGRINDSIDHDFFKDRSIVDGFEYASVILLNKNIPKNHKSAGVFRKELVKKLNYFSNLSADIFFTIGMASLGDIAYIPEQLFLYRYHAGSSEGMGYLPLKLSLESLEQLFGYSWIKKNKKWMDIKTEALKKMRFIIPLMYIFNHFKTYGRKQGFKIAKSVTKDFPLVKKNKLFMPSVWIMTIIPRKLIKFFELGYRKLSWPKKAINFIFSRKK
ncbi:MAG: glycosyltransferase family 2 protein [Spirochaetes bacterium]|nr:glycosyltransferase family 2 protein [Spirochaetota bacterium]